MKKDAIFSEKREVRTFIELNHASNTLLQTTDEHLKENFYTVMSSLLLRAFAFEAYLNHLGEKHLKLWRTDEHVPVWTKFRRICDRIDFAPNRSVRPFLTLQDLFHFRNTLAHGRSEVLEVVGREVNLTESVVEHRARTSWEKYCTRENAELAKLDT